MVWTPQHTIKSILDFLDYHKVVFNGLLYVNEAIVKAASQSR